jgi:hypothetical protein
VLLNNIDIYDIDWMFVLAFTLYPGTYAQTQGVAFYMHIMQVRIHSLSTCSHYRSSHTHVDLELVYSIAHICLFLYSRLIAPTARPPASRIWSPPDTRKPRR